VNKQKHQEHEFSWIGILLIDLLNFVLFVCLLDPDLESAELDAAELRRQQKQAEREDAALEREERRIYSKGKTQKRGRKQDEYDDDDGQISNI
jgi:hypothetical protein